MSSNFRGVASAFKKSFDFSKVSKINWFPGHMTRGTRQMQHTMLKTDCIIEVHDARIALSGRNTNFRSYVTGSSRPHILVLNKKDLAFSSTTTKEEMEEIRRLILRRDPLLSDVIFTNCKNPRCPGLRSVLPKAIDLITNADRYHRAGAPDSNFMIIGVPNVGKSTLINLIRSGTLRLKGALKVGPMPGVTRAIETKIRVNNDPLVYMLDTPGIMMPNIADKHIGMKLACCATLKDNVVGEQLIAEYALFHLNKTENFSYVEAMHLQEPIDDYRVVLAVAAIKQGMVFKSSFDGAHKPDLQAAAKHFLRVLRSGKLGPINFDHEALFQQPI